MARSLLEGVAYEVRRLVELGRRCGIEAATATMVGGATASPVWPQILADVLGLPLSLPVTVGTDGGTAAACRGAAVLAGAACGVFSDVLAGAALCDARGRVFTPQAANTRRYDDLYGVYCQAFSSLRGAFADLARLAG
jgi:sugar (pentulose or hexulose) kinase